MNLTLVTGPRSEPVSLPSAKLHLRVDGNDDDDFISALIVTAREHVESITRRKLLTQTWDYSMPGWPCASAFKLPFGNLASVTNVKWKGETGTETTLTVTTDYLVETNGSECGRIVLPYGGTWPSGTLYPSNPITVRFVCGWTTEDNVPYAIRAAIKLFLAKLYESRGEDTVGQLTTSFSEDKTYKTLLQPYRLWDF